MSQGWAATASNVGGAVKGACSSKSIDWSELDLAVYSVPLVSVLRLLHLVSLAVHLKYSLKSLPS